MRFLGFFTPHGNEIDRKKRSTLDHMFDWGLATGGRQTLGLISVRICLWGRLEALADRNFTECRQSLPRINFQES
jgi:hypothetical protein